MWSNIEPSRKRETSANEQDAIKIDSGSPLMRYKHAVCSASSGYIYIHGGRFGNLPLDDDVWRFDPHHNSWLQLETRGSKPPSLQEHTLVEYNEQLYLFGGQVSASSTENSFWRLDLLSGEWRSLGLKSSKSGAHLGPTNRRGHSAVVYGDSMYIYGGFEDFRGSSAQLWEYNLICESWQLRDLSSSSNCHPEPRHSHSAIVYNHSMFVYGGLSNLKPLSDLWRWSWREKRWFKERARGNPPGQLHGHTAIQAFGSMFVFGGERNGRPSRSLWRLNLSNMSWQKIRAKGPRPSPTTWHGAIANPLSILDEANYIVEGDPDLLKNTASLSEIGVYKTGSLVSNHSNAETAQPDRSRKSRLSFLRRYRQRPRSSYELKEVEAKQIRHSISIAIPSTKVEKEQETNVKILDTLEGDIKQMFDSALNSSNHKEVDESMSVEITTGQYQTAILADQSDLNLRSQRTSYAYATPPSELVTLRDESKLVSATQSRSNQGFNRRDNRPKSEIVQSLIERADARIKHLYTPYFNHDADSTLGERQLKADLSRRARDSQQREQRHRLSLDRTKRHTIHQTMTYYNLYFSEDKSSTSPPSSGDSNQQAPSANEQSTRAQSTISSTDNEQTSANQRLTRDDLSSSTIKASYLTAQGSGTLVGVHGSSQIDQQSQLSLDANSSDSRTLCADSNPTLPEISNDATFASTSLHSTMGNALTGRRDTTGAESNCDNTSLSFSVIAEFEEDDMLQYSSPTDSSIATEFAPSSSSYQQQVETKPMILDHADEIGEPENEQQLPPPKQQDHNSASSGYSSIGNGFERQAPDSSHLNGRTTNDLQEDSSVTTESSAGLITDTSPEQSSGRHKKLRPMMQRQVQTDLKTTTSSTTADSLALASESFDFPLVVKSLPSSPPEKDNSQRSEPVHTVTQRKLPLMRTKFFSGKRKSRNRYWQLCMFVIGGKHNGAHGTNEPITIWRLYI